MFDFSFCAFSSLYWFRQVRVPFGPGEAHGSHGHEMRALTATHPTSSFLFLVAMHLLLLAMHLLLVL